MSRLKANGRTIILLAPIVSWDLLRVGCKSFLHGKLKYATCKFRPLCESSGTAGGWGIVG